MQQIHLKLKEREEEEEKKFYNFNMKHFLLLKTADN